MEILKPTFPVCTKESAVTTDTKVKSKTVSKIDSAYEVLSRVWGFDEFRPLQEEAVTDVIEGRDSVVVLPTGGGKSLCYQVPALVREGMAVVVSPLISLMKDQVDSLVGNGVAAALVNSSQSEAQKRETAARIRSGEIRLLYLAPEKLLTSRTLDFLAKVPISFFAIDEAHCVSNWGHDFRPEYRGLRMLKERFPHASVHAFTATASERVRDDIAEQLDLQSPKILVGNFDRPNLTYRMIRRSNPLQQIMGVIDQFRGESGVVYCITRKEVEQTAAALAARGVSALPYHAGLDDIARRENQDAFIKEKVDVIVATVAFGMGIDKSNVRFVIHAGMPKSIEHYQQESGRAGRDGLASQCTLLYNGSDLMTWKRIMEMGDGSNFDEAMANINAMSDLCSGVRCRHAAIVNYFGQEYDVDNCNACDVCLGELDTVEDALTLAQKILSNVVRLQERFGIAHNVKVLTGARDQKILNAGHDKLSTYNLLGNESASAVRIWLEQLISQNFLQRTGEYNILTLTPSGRDLLRRNGTVTLTRAAPSSGGGSSGLSSSGLSSSGRGPAAEDSWEGVDRKLFDELRNVRKELAAEKSVPAYIIFNDAVLRDLARVRPTRLAKLGQIRGIGEQKLKEYGGLFLGHINAFCQNNETARDVAVTKDYSAPAAPPQPKSMKGVMAQEQASEMFAQGKTMEEVAVVMGRAQSTVRGYLCRYIDEAGITDVSHWVDPEKIKIIEEAIPASEDGRLKPIHEAIEANEAVTIPISFEDIQFTLAAYQVKHRSE